MRISAPGRFVMLTVRDTGSGMAENVRARIFEPFFTTKFLGRGLGLPAVQGVVRGHRGGIAVDSAPGKGTVMKLYLPAAGEVAKVCEAQVAAPNAGRRVVLVVDDEDMVRKVARAALEKRGYTVITAEDGEAAVRVFSEQSREHCRRADGYDHACYGGRGGHRAHPADPAGRAGYSVQRIQPERGHGTFRPAGVGLHSKALHGWKTGNRGGGAGERKIRRPGGGGAFKRLPQPRPPGV